MLIIEPGDPKDPPVTALLMESHAMLQDLFPPEEIYSLSLQDLIGPDIHFFVARDGSAILGTGALVVKDGYGEVKSMFTAPNARGRGVAAALLRQIEDCARAVGLPLLRLETADILQAAIRLYLRHGFERRGIFGAYAPNETSVYMEKPLTS